MARQRDVWLVGDLAREVTRLVAGGFPDSVWVRGEITGFKPGRNGHAFFDLADLNDASQTFPCVLWRDRRLGMEAYLRRYGLELGEGVEVEVCGRVEHQARSGRIQLNLTGIDPEFTAGRKALARDALLRELRTSGLIDANKSRTLAAMPLRVALVTAGGSAAHADVVRVMSSSEIGFQLLTIDTVVQGAGAPVSIAAALGASVQHGVDLVLLARGGGSRSDLAAFDSREVALAIAHSPVPVWSGVGHDVDQAVADEVAQRAFATPTALAAALVEYVRAAITRAEGLWTRINYASYTALERHAQLLAFHARRAAVSVGEAVSADTQRLDHIAARLAREPRAALGRHTQALDGAMRAATACARSRIDRADAQLGAGGATAARRCALLLERAESRLATASAVTRHADPAVLARRGWAYLTHDGSLVRSIHDVTVGATIHAHVGDGTLVATVVAARSRTPDHEPPSN